jgi:hypothetical protein
MTVSARQQAPQAEAFVVLVVNDLAPYRDCSTINNPPKPGRGSTGPTGALGPTSP